MISKSSLCQRPWPPCFATARPDGYQKRLAARCSRGCRQTAGRSRSSQALAVAIDEGNSISGLTARPSRRRSIGSSNKVWNSSEIGIHTRRRFHAHPPQTPRALGISLRSQRTISQVSSCALWAESSLPPGYGSRSITSMVGNRSHPIRGWRVTTGSSVGSQENFCNRRLPLAPPAHYSGACDRCFRKASEAFMKIACLGSPRTAVRGLATGPENIERPMPSPRVSWSAEGSRVSGAGARGSISRACQSTPPQASSPAPWTNRPVCMRLAAAARPDEPRPSKTVQRSSNRAH